MTIIRMSDLPKDVRKKLKSCRRRKYGNQPTEYMGIRFASKKEAHRYQELLLMEKAGLIQSLRVHPKFICQDKFTMADGTKVKAIPYTADFDYCLTKDGTWVIEDCKGGNATKTQAYEIKKKMMQKRYGITIAEV